MPNIPAFIDYSNNLSLSNFLSNPQQDNNGQDNKIPSFDEFQKSSPLEIPVSSIQKPKLIKKKDLNKLSFDSSIPSFEEFNKNIPSFDTHVSTKNLDYEGDVLRINSAKQTAPKLPTVTQEEDKKSFIGKAISNISRMNEPDVTNKNPKGVIKEVRFSLPANSDGSTPNQSEISKAFLSQLGGEYANVGETFKSQTGLDLAQISQQELPSAVIGKRVVNGKTYYDFGTKLTQGTLDLINAYNESGLEGYRSEWEDQFRANQKFNKEWKQYENFYSGFIGDVRRGIGYAAVGMGQRVENLRRLVNGESISDTISRKLGKVGEGEQTTIADQKSLDEARSNLSIRAKDGSLSSYSTGLGGLVGETINAGVFVAGLGPVPIASVYLDNLHKGQGEAIKAATGMALMQAAGHFVGNIADGANFNPASRQILIRGSQGTINYLFAALNGEKDPSSLFNQFAVGSLFPAGKGKQVDEFTNKLNIPTIIDRTPIDAFVAPSVSTSVKEQVRQQLSLAAPKVDIPLNTSTTNISSGDILRPRESTEFVGMKGFPRENVGFEATAEPQTIKMNLEDANALLLDLQRYRSSTEGKDLEINQAQILDKAILNLQNAIPQDFQDYFTKNEKTIREALKPKVETKRDETRVITQESNTKATVSENLKGNSITGKESSVEFLNKVREKFRDGTGENNKWTSQEGYVKKLDDLKSVPSINQLNDVTQVGKFFADKVGDLTYLAAFHIEDFYRRSIEPTLDAFANRLKNDLGDLFDKFSPEQVKTLFENGKNYYESNNADPFFSGLKQEILEKLPNKFNANQARAIIGQEKFKNEIKWTVGLDDFLENMKDGKATKDDLINVLNSGQVRIEEKILGSSYTTKNSLEDIDNQLIQKGFTPQQLSVKDVEQILGSNAADDWYFHVHGDIRPSSYPPTRYGLADYSGEKLETEGGKNYKELLLISPISREKSADFIYELYNVNTGEVLDKFYNRDEAILHQQKETSVRLVHNPQKESYDSSHWSDSSVIVHIRFNERTVDGKRVLFVEEIQSDWNQTGRKEGYRSEEGKDSYRLNELLDKSLSDNITEEERKELYKLKAKSYDIPENPFMANNWKELAIKRTLRYAAENGFDKVAWTSSEMQQKRYNKVLEGKILYPQKNADGTYTISLEDSSGTIIHNPETEHISREKFVQLTNEDIVKLADERLKDSKIGDKLPKIDLGETIKIGQGYGDYDKGYPIIFNKIGKRFGAKVGENEIETGKILYDVIKNGKYEGETYSLSEATHLAKLIDGEVVTKIESLKEKVPSIEITPSMRQSLTKEGQPIYGTSGLGDFPKGAPTGIRNRIVTLENYKQSLGTLEEAATNFFQNESPQLNPEDYAIELLKDRGIDVTRNPANGSFIINNEGQKLEVAPEDFIAKARQIDQRISTELDALTKPLAKEMPPPINSDGTVFNSGLNPEEFIKQAKLLWGGIKDFGTFSRTLIQKFGEGIKPYLISIRNWISEEFKIKGNEESQQGFLGINLNPPKNPALDKFLETPLENLEISKGKKADKRFAMRSVAVMQLHPDNFGPIWNTLADAEGLTNSYKSKLVQDIHAAQKLLESGLENDVATALYEGDKNKKVYSPAELKSTFNLTPEQIQAYQKIRQAQDRVLEVNLLTKVYPLWQKLSTFVAGSPDYNNLIKQVNDLTGYYQGLKNRGYVTRQRLGKIAVFAEDPAFPIGDIRRKLYTQVENKKEAVATLTQWFNKYKAINGDSHFINKKNIIAELQFLANKITPAAIENLIDSSTADRNDPQIVRLVDEVYNRFPSSSYELKRDYTRGMEESWKNLLINLAHQNEVYANKYYSKIGGEQAKLLLGQSSLLKTDPNLYKIAASFIQDATTPYEGDWFQKLSAKARSKVYFMQLGYQFWQFVNNGITQPMQQTYSYFGRVENSGIKLTGAEPEVYFTQGLKLAKETMKENLGKTSSSMPIEFRNIYKRLQDEHLVTQEFTRSLMEGEINKSTLDIEREVGLRKSRLWQKLTREWPSVFQEKGEKTTRTITAAEAYLVGSEKFKLAGEELYKFIRTAIVSTQGAFGKAENPYLIRKAGEIGKLFYQFSSYNQMWLENLGLAIKADRELGRFTATPRHILPVLLTAGVKGLPAYAIAKTLYTLLTGKNPEEDFKKALKNHSLLANFALYGMSSNAGIGAKLGATIPFLDNLAQIITDPSRELSFENVPAINTFMQVGKGGIDVFTKGQRMRGLEEISPAAIKNILKAARYNREGVKSKGGQTEVPASKINGIQKGMQIFGVTPPAVIEHYEGKRMDNVKRVGKPIRKFLKLSH